MNDEENKIPSSSDLSEVDPQLKKLIQDLNNTSKISAPDNFETLLYERIKASESKTIPWYKRIFYSHESGRLRLPALAYGSIATIIICFIGYYALVTLKIFDSTQGVTVNEQPVQKQIQTPQAKQMETRTDQQLSPKKSAEEFHPKEMYESQPQKLPEQPVVIPKSEPSAPQDKETKIKSPEGAGSEAPQPQQKMERMDKTIPVQTPLMKTERKSADEKDIYMKVRGITPEEKKFALPMSDSSAIKDSLRKIDSLSKQLRPAEKK